MQVRDQQNRLLNLRMLEEIDADTFASASRDLRDREAELKLEIDVADRGRHEIIDIAAKAFELSHNLREKWLTADYPVKRRYLEIVFLNLVLGDVTLVVEKRKPFDELAKRPSVTSSRDDARRFEPLETLAATCVRAYPADRPPQLRFLAGLASEDAEE